MDSLKQTATFHQLEELSKILGVGSQLILYSQTSTHDGLAFKHIAHTITTGNFLALVVNAGNLYGRALVHLITTLHGHIILVVRVGNADARTVFGAEIGVLTFPNLTNHDVGVQDVL